jgi:hypothetical protein
VVYSNDDHATREYFPLELSNVDYAARILRCVSHVLRELYRQIRQEDLAPPSLEEGRSVEPQDLDNIHLFKYVLSARASLVYSKLLQLDVGSLMTVVSVLLLAEGDMMKAPVPAFWSPVKVRRLFDAGLRVVEAAAGVGFGQWASFNLSSLRGQYKQHMSYRDDRLQTNFPHGALIPNENYDENDEAWGIMDESKFWRPASPVVVVKSKASKAREKDDSVQKETAAAARVEHLSKVASWELIFAELPSMDNSQVGDGTGERLRIAVEGRLKLMHDVKRTREAEALANRHREYKNAKKMQEQLNNDLLPKLREYEAEVEQLWKSVAPAELMDSVSALVYGSHVHAQDAANARDYVTARTLTEAQSRLAVSSFSFE